MWKISIQCKSQALLAKIKLILICFSTYEVNITIPLVYLHTYKTMGDTYGL